MADQILRICLIKEIRKDFLLNSPLSIFNSIVTIQPMR